MAELTRFIRPKQGGRKGSRTMSRLGSRRPGVTASRERRKGSRTLVGTITDCYDGVSGRGGCSMHSGVCHTFLGGRGRDLGLITPYRSTRQHGIRHPDGGSIVSLLERRAEEIRKLLCESSCLFLSQESIPVNNYTVLYEQERWKTSDFWKRCRKPLWYAASMRIV